MGHQPEYCQHHSHEQTEPAPSFGREKAEQTAFHQSACRNLLNPVRLISHNIVTSLAFDRQYQISKFTSAFILVIKLHSVLQQ